MLNKAMAAAARAVLRLENIGSSVVCVCLRVCCALVMTQ